MLKYIYKLKYICMIKLLIYKEGDLMILSGKEIHKNVLAGDIIIEPFDKSKINPNSYNLTLSN